MDFIKGRQSILQHLIEITTSCGRKKQNKQKFSQLIILAAAELKTQFPTVSINSKILSKVLVQQFYKTFLLSYF